MNTENQETIADIITVARGVFDELRKHGYNVVSVDRMADIIDRVEEAHKREREAGAEAAQICGEIGEMVGREEAKNKSVTNCNRFCNAAKMREALENIAEYAKAAECHTEDAHLLGYLNQIAMWAEDALSAPPRNCDVGTPTEKDACLIAAAQELYEALQSLVEYIDRECIPCGENACELLDAAHNALAKAAGESEVKG